MITEQMAVTFYCYQVVPNLSGPMKNEEQYSANNSLTPVTVLLFISGIM